MNLFGYIRLTLLVVLCVAEFDAGAAPSGIVADWTFNNTLADASGYGNNLLVYTGQVSYASGPFAGQEALKLNGDTELTTASGAVPSQFSSGNNPYSVAIYFESSPTGSLYGGLFGYGSNDNGRMEEVRLGGLTNSSATSLTDVWGDDNLAATLLAGQSSTNAWHSLVTTWDGTTQEIYLDGRLASSRTGISVDVGTNWLYVGGAIAAHNFTGGLADVEVANFAVSSSQVANYASSGSLSLPSPGPAPEPGTVALLGVGGACLWRFRRSSGR